MLNYNKYKAGRGNVDIGDGITARQGSIGLRDVMDLDKVATLQSSSNSPTFHDFFRYFQQRH